MDAGTETSMAVNPENSAGRGVPYFALLADEPRALLDS
jgi:hypothetical protein